VVHANAPMSELGRLRLARCIFEDGWPIARAAERFQVSRTTATRWRSAIGAWARSGWRIGPPARTGPRIGPARRSLRKIVQHRTKKRLGLVQIAPLVGVVSSTVHRVLTRCGLARLAWLDRATGAPVRYEYPDPGGLVHVDVKKLGNIPAGGGWRKLGRAQGRANRVADRGRARNRHGHELLGHGFIHAVVDDHTRRGVARCDLTARILDVRVRCRSVRPVRPGSRLPLLERQWRSTPRRR
jgi:transposase